MLLILLVYTLLWNKYPQLHSSTIKSLVLILKPLPSARLVVGGGKEYESFVPPA